MLPQKNQQLFNMNGSLLPNYNFNQLIFSSEKLQNCRKWEKNSQWSLIEKAYYALFIQFNSKCMQGKSHNSLWRVYELMARLIKTRNYRQCKLYHQKMLLKYNNIAKILEQLSNNNPQLEGIILRQRESIRRQQISSKFSPNNVIEKIPTDSSYRLTLQDLEKINKQRNLEKNLDKYQSLKYSEQAFVSLSNKIKQFVMPTLCA